MKTRIPRAAAIAWIFCAWHPHAGSQPTGSGSGFDESATRATLASLGEQIASYRGVLRRMAGEEGSAAARELLARIDGLGADAARLAAAGRSADAVEKLRDAYRRVVEGLSRLQAGRTVTSSLKFESPADEYAYEERRYQSNEMMVGMMLNEGRSGNDRQPVVDELATDAKRLRTEAADLARDGNHAAAVAVMENANALLNRALRSMGVPVF